MSQTTVSKKPLTKGNYKSPSCAYCHMRNGKHQVADKTIWKFGLQEVNPRTSGNEVRRTQWVEVCCDCHDAEWSRKQLAGMDAERKRTWSKLYAAERAMKDLRSDDLLHPSADARPPYPLDKPGALFARERIGFLEGQSSAFYNVSPIERDYFEMWYFDNLGAYKGAAHGAPDAVARGHEKMDTALENLRKKAQTLRQQGNPPAGGAWGVEGEYAGPNKVNN